MKINEMTAIVVNGVEYYQKQEVAQVIDYALTCVQCAMGVDDGDMSIVEDSDKELTDIIGWINATYRQV